MVKEGLLYLIIRILNRILLLFCCCEGLPDIIFMSNDKHLFLSLRYMYTLTLKRGNSDRTSAFFNFELLAMSCDCKHRVSKVDRTPAVAIICPPHLFHQVATLSLNFRLENHRSKITLIQNSRLYRKCLTR